MKKEISNSPGYYITDDGKVFNKDNKLLKTFFKKDGYERVRLYSIKHNKYVNRSIHLLVAESFLNSGTYAGKNEQINHIDGNKKNNTVQNLEPCTNTENVNHAHDNNLYTYDLPVDVIDNVLCKIYRFRSIREFSRFINKSLNFTKTRIKASKYFPILKRYIAYVDFNKYINHISELKGKKNLIAFDHVANKKYHLTSYSQIALLFSIPYTTIGKKLNKEPNTVVYQGGVSFALKDIPIKRIELKTALKDRDDLWSNL